MTRPRSPTTGKFIKRSLLDRLASIFKGKPDKDAPTLIEHDPKAQERNTTRSKGK